MEVLLHIRLLEAFQAKPQTTEARGPGRHALPAVPPNGRPSTQAPKATLRGHATGLVTRTSVCQPQDGTHRVQAAVQRLVELGPVQVNNLTFGSGSNQAHSTVILIPNAKAYAAARKRHP